jgi:hypothetical protein
MVDQSGQQFFFPTARGQPFDAAAAGPSSRCVSLLIRQFSVEEKKRGADKTIGLAASPD